MLNFRPFLQEDFLNYIFFSVQLNILKHILALSVNIIKLVSYIKKKSDNHVMLEIKLSS